MELIGKKTGTTYYPTIGLEIHAEMKTNTKMFCRCKNDPFASAPNTHICPVCTGQPGALPYVNKQAVKNVMKVGVALGANLADFSEFDRKNYFYPDIPKAYQISQYQYPLVSNGSLLGIAIERIHMEEDTATSIHKGTYSLVDYNRSSVPLMELVTKPVVHDAETAVAFAKELQLLLRTIGVGDANLEKGEMRIEANISLSPHGYFDGDFKKLGTKTEVKNLNSFKIVGAAIEYELKRQLAILEGETEGELVQETRGWDEAKQCTFSQRSKETADDYRYFPDPDIPKYKFSELPEFARDALAAELPELPWDKRARYAKDFGLKEDDVEFFVNNSVYDALFVDAVVHVSGVDAYQKLANYITTVLVGYENGETTGSVSNVTGVELAHIVHMIDSGALSSRGAREVLLELYTHGGSAERIAADKGLLQQSDENALAAIVAQIIADNPTQTADYKAGQTKLLQYFVGQGMKATKGAGNPGVLAELFKKAL